MVDKKSTVKSYIGRQNDKITCWPLDRSTGRHESSLCINNILYIFLMEMNNLKRVTCKKKIVADIFCVN